MLLEDVSCEAQQPILHYLISLVFDGVSLGHHESVFNWANLLILQLCVAFQLTGLDRVGVSDNKVASP